MPSKVWDEITYPFPNFNGATERISAGYWIDCPVSRCVCVCGEGVGSGVGVHVYDYREVSLLVKRER